MAEIDFVYLDLGNVLVNFSHEQMIQQIAQVGEVDSQSIKKVFFENGLQREYETGQISTTQFHTKFCELTGSKASMAELEKAAADIFSLNTEIVPLVGQMQIAGIRLGILSNTCEAHWKWVQNRYSIIKSAFREVVLSYEVGSTKPDEAIFREAIQRAGCPAERIFFTDDIAENVAGAAAANIRASQFNSAKNLAVELNALGLRFNY